MRRAGAIVALATLLAACSTTDQPRRVALQDNCRSAHPAVFSTRISTRSAELRSLTGQLKPPDRAVRMARGGFATLSCKPAGGRLAACRLLSETPADMGFARSALAHAPLVVYPDDDVRDRVEVTFRFDVVAPGEGLICS
ncbi:hypothetical protein [Caulobacter mirabilis]|uniref:TonB C-terminal domain-containing protein n=1 Tax=Caulobacter mirabilis TaxID=69666 RepID=A0A2D2AST5_9CAUL|nr:hypothetical protein [Caulobacter mirabilis]ATQ41037.1 hypothetical protein CSW64_00750 [Caulobacter mirabilis]